jgi:MFS family permease
VWTVIIGVGLMGISGICAVSVSSPVHAGALLGWAFFFGSFAYPGGPAIIQKTTPPDLRARVSAVYLFVTTLFAAAVGPTFIAIITDFVFVDPAAVGRSLAVALSISAPVGVACGLIAASQLRKFASLPNQ